VAKKTDPSITFLNRWGYNVVKLPRAGIEPMDVIGNDGTNQLLGPLSTVWTSDTPVPQPGAPQPSGVVNGQQTEALDLDLGLSVLAGALAAFGATVPSLHVAYKTASKVQFSYTGVTSTSVNVLEAGNYLAKGKLSTENPAVKNYFLSPKSKLYLITDVLKTTSVTVSATNEHGEEVGLDVPAIQGMVGASVKVSPSSSSNSTITYTGSLPITFGFAALEIQRVDDAWTLRGAKASGELAFAIGDDEPQAGGDDSKVLLETDGGQCRVDL
jgi:hypothetical protein